MLFLYLSELPCEGFALYIMCNLQNDLTPVTCWPQHLTYVRPWSFLTCFSLKFSFFNICIFHLAELKEVQNQYQGSGQLQKKNRMISRSPKPEPAICQQIRCFDRRQYTITCTTIITISYLES